MVSGHTMANHIPLRVLLYCLGHCLQGQPAGCCWLDSSSRRTGARYVPHIPQQLLYLCLHTRWAASGHVFELDGAGGVGGAIPALQRLDPDYT